MISCCSENKQLPIPLRESTINESCADRFSVFDRLKDGFLIFEVLPLEGLQEVIQTVFSARQQVPHRSGNSKVGKILRGTTANAPEPPAQSG